jgi:hypothetical protein
MELPMRSTAKTALFAAAAALLATQADAAPTRFEAPTALAAPLAAEPVFLKPAAQCARNPICRTAAQDALSRAGQRLLKRVGETVDNLIDLAIEALYLDPVEANRLIEAVETEARRHCALDAATKAYLDTARRALQH